MENLGERFINLIESGAPIERICTDRLGQTILRTGGIESILVCFAEVVRTRHHYVTSTKIHSNAFSVLLHMSQSNKYYLSKFLDELNGLKLAEFILSHPLCRVSNAMLNNYFDFCLIGIEKQNNHTNQHHQDNINSHIRNHKLESIVTQSATTTSTTNHRHHQSFSSPSDYYELIKSPTLIYHLITSWRAWHKDPDVAQVFYERLGALIQTQLFSNAEERQKVENNHRMLTEAGGITLLMDILRECLVPVDEDVPNHINHQLIELLMNSISLLIIHPPSLELISDLMGLLIFLHPDHKAYVEPHIDQIASFNHQTQFHAQPNKCSNRSFAIAQLADMLASIVKLTSNDPMGLLSKTLQTSIIDPRKLIILVNNSSHLVREKVFRLFLYCMKACYSLNLRTLLDKYEQPVASGLTSSLSSASSSSSIRLNLPIQLMALQLLRYPTTIKMVQLCYGIIVGADDFEAIDKVCSDFDIDPANNQLQLNTLLLLIQLTTQLPTDKEILLALRFIRKYLEQLTDLGQESIVLNLIKRTLVDSVMKLYFLYIEQKVHQSKLREMRKKNAFGCNAANSSLDEEDEDCIQSNASEDIRLRENITFSGRYMNDVDRSFGHEGDVYDDDGDEEEDDDDDDESIEDGTDESIKDGYDEVRDELDRLLILITCSYLQNLTTNEAIKALRDLQIYMNSLNCNVPHQFQKILRNRSVKVLATALHYCYHYEQWARSRQYGGKLDYYIKSLFKSNQLNSFNNTISESEFVGILYGNLYYEKSPSSSSTDDDCGDENDSSIYDNTNYHKTSTINSGGGGSSSSRHRRTTNRASSSNFSNSAGSSLLSDNAKPFMAIHDSDAKLRQRYRQNEAKEITEQEVLERFETVFELVVDFVVTREPGVIPSPLEREFIMRCIRTLYRYLLELKGHRKPTSSPSTLTNEKGGKSHWSLLLPKLERLFRGTFTQLILFLLSPCDAMSSCERRLMAHKLFSNNAINLSTSSTLEVDKMLPLLDQDSGRSAYVLLLLFTKDLLDYNSNAVDDETATTSISDYDEELDFSETTPVLRLLIVTLEYELERSNYGKRSSVDLQHRSMEAARAESKLDSSQQNEQHEQDTRFRSVWLADLYQTREEARERARVFIEQKRANSSSILGGAEISAAATAPSMSIELSNSNVGSTEVDRIVLEAVSITRQVVDDKHELRKVYLEAIKQKKVFNYHIRQQWLSLIIGHTHERAVWHMPDYYPKAWELNPVEGPSRIRRRLRSCKMALEARFLRRRQLLLNDADQLLSSCKTKEFALKTIRSHSKGGFSSLPASSGESSSEDESTNEGPYQQEIHSINEESEASQSDDQEEENEEDQEDQEEEEDEWHNYYSPHPLFSLVLNCNEQTMDSNELRIRMFTTDKIHFNCDCSIIRPNEVCEGEVSIASWCIHFIGERSDTYQRHLVKDLGRKCKRVASATQTSEAIQKTPSKKQRRADLLLDSTTTNPPPLNTLKSLNSSRPAYVATLVEDLWFDEIVEIWDRRYQLQDVGLEIFLTNNMTYLLSFRTQRDREDFKHYLFKEQHKMINLQRFNSSTCLNRLTRLWRDGKLTNFDYLTCLNKLAGRSFNDLMQYPIFPFVLSNYHSDVLDLNNSANYRRLDRPMAIQNKQREEIFKNNYQFSQANLTTGPLSLTKPYHYGNHYSNSATVLHFLVRLPPFTQMLIQYQDNNFDQPDRTFHSMASTWQLITRDSHTDFKELIPEFFFLPEMFTNIEQLDLGKKQNNELVDDVRLPAWCPYEDARLFTMIHRQALESACVSENLHHWIDLIFGHKQTGKAAIDSLNVFHPATYYGGIDLAASVSLPQAPVSASQNSTNFGNQQTISGSSSLMNGNSSCSLGGGASGGATFQILPPPALNAATIGASISARSSKYDSDYISDTDAALQHQQQKMATTNNNSQAGSDTSSQRRLLLKRGHTSNPPQADIERSALETMIKTYGQMPRQLFSQPVRQRSMSTFAGQLNQSQLERLASVDAYGRRLAKRLEPLKQVRGLKWGSYVGSPDEGEIIAVSHRRLPDDSASDNSASNNNVDQAAACQQLESSFVATEAIEYDRRLFDGGSSRRRKKTDHESHRLARFHLCLLANGDVAILRKNTCLMLDYRTDRKNSGIQAYQLSLPSMLSGSGTKKQNSGKQMLLNQYNQHRAGLSNIARMNLFSNMIISRQQFTFIEPIHSASSQLDSLNSSSSSPLASLIGSINVRESRFSQDSLTLVSWNTSSIGKDEENSSGLIKVRWPATNSQSQSIPLIEAPPSSVDRMSTCCCIPELNLLLVGHESGAICAHIISSTHELASRSRVTTATAHSDYAAPSAIHFLHKHTSSSSTTSRAMSSESSSPLLSKRLLTPLNSPHLSGNKKKSSPPASDTNSIGSLQTVDGLHSAHYLQTPKSSQQLNGSSFIQPLNKTSRWLYCHNKKVNCIKINVSFGIVVTGSDDGTSVIWDLNSLTYVRTIDYKIKSLVLKNQSSMSASQRALAEQEYLSWNYGRANTNRLFDYLCRCQASVLTAASAQPTPDRNQRKHSHNTSAKYSSASPYNSNSTRCCICCSGISLIAISDTLGDIVTVKNFSDRLALATTDTEDAITTSSASSYASSSSSLNGDLDMDNLTSVVYVHTINGSLIGYINCHTQVTAVCYSNAAEGVSVNVIVVGMSNGLVRLYSSWDLCRVKEFRISDMDSPVSSLLYSLDSQLLYIVYDDDRMVVLRNKRKGSVNKPKELVICDR